MNIIYKKWPIFFLSIFLFMNISSGKRFSHSGDNIDTHKIEKRTTYTECFKTSPVPDVFPNRFFKWRWIELNRTENDFDQGAECGVFWYEHAPALPDHPMLVVLDLRYPESDFDLIMFGNLTVKDKIWTATIKYPTDKTVSTYSVLGIDSSYALIYTCTKDGGVVKERAWVMAPRKPLPKGTWEKIDGAIDEQSEKAGEDLRARLRNVKMKSCEDIIVENPCYNISSMSGLDPDRFFKWSWNQVWRSQNDFENGTECASQTFRTFNATFNPMRRITITYNYSGGKKIQAIGNLTPTKNDIDIRVQYPNMKGRARSKFTIIETDYNSFAVVYSCRQKSLKEKQEGLWILSRASNIEEKAETFIESDNYLKRLKQGGMTCQKRD